MKYLILFLALLPAMVMGIFFLYGSGFVWFDDMVRWAEHAFSLSIYLFHAISSISSLSFLPLVHCGYW